MAFEKKGYNGNPFLKQTDEPVEFTAEQIQEILKCSESVEYFLENYARIVSLDDGIVNFKPYPYQRRILTALGKHRKIAVKLGRQNGKSQIVAGYIAWFSLFKENKTSCILANKASTAKEIFSRVQFIIEMCPKWLQQGIKEWNKTSFILENGSKCFCAATSPSAVRGQSINCVTGDTEVQIRHKVTKIEMTVNMDTLTKILSIENAKTEDFVIQIQ